MASKDQLQPQPEFFTAITKSLKVLQQVMAGKTHSIHLLDAHVQPLGVGARYIESAHCSPCLSLPITLEELHIAQEIWITEEFKIGIAAYVVIMATGGVEWNTITILKLQRSPGLVVSRFKNNSTTGDLNRVALENGLSIFCNFGCSGDSSISLTNSISRISPEIFWICNWSVQDESEKSDYHKLAEKVKIVDQRSYDTQFVAMPNY